MPNSDLSDSVGLPTGNELFALQLQMQPELIEYMMTRWKALKSLAVPDKATTALAFVNRSHLAIATNNDCITLETPLRAVGPVAFGGYWDLPWVMWLPGHACALQD